MNSIISHFVAKLNRLFSETNTALFGGTGGWESNYVEITDQARQEAFVAILEALDEEFFASAERKSQYLSKDKASKTLVTTFGTLTFKRRKYTHRSYRTTFYFIDRLLELSPYQRVSNDTQAAVLTGIVADKLSYDKAAGKYGLSKGYAYSLIQSLEDKLPEMALESRIETDYLHIVADEDHVAKQDKSAPRKASQNNTHMLRHVTLYTNLKRVSKNRNQLENRVVFSQYHGESILDFCERISHFIANNYAVKNETFVYGDGAGWIRTLADEVGTRFILDAFHVMQAVFRLCGGKTQHDNRELMLGYLRADKKNEFFMIVEALNPDMSEFKRKQADYLERNWAFYQNNHKIPQALVCCAEGINSHYFASRLSSRPKGFSVKAIHTLGALLAIQATSKKVGQYLKDQLPSLVKPIPKKQKARPSNPNIKYLSDSIHLPILDSKTSGTRTLIHSLVS